MLSTIVLLTHLFIFSNCGAYGFVVNHEELVASQQLGDFDKELSLTVFIDESSLWKSKTVLEDIRNAEKVLSQCKVAIHPIKVLRGTHENLKGITSVTDYKFTRDIPDSYHRPFVVYTDGTLRPPTAIRPIGGYANHYLSKNHSFREDSLFTVFFGDIRLTHYEKTPNYLKNIFPWTLAHELGHILLTSGHLFNAKNNLMEDSWELRSFKLTEQQCRSIRKMRLVQDREAVKQHWKSLYNIFTEKQ